MTLASTSRNTEGLCIKCSLLDLKHASNREDYISERFFLNTVIRKAFRSVAAFFERLDTAHVDALRHIQIKECCKGGWEGPFLLSPHVMLSDEEFVNVNALSVAPENLSLIARRLDYIQRNKRQLFNLGNPSDTPSWWSCLTEDSMSFKQIRNLDSEGKIGALYKRKCVPLLFLSPKQKGSIVDFDLFQRLLSSDTRHNRVEFVSLIPAKVLNGFVSKMDDLSRIPHSAIGKLDLQRLSMRKFYSLMRNNMRHLDKADLDHIKMPYLLNRIVTQALRTHPVEMNVSNQDGKRKVFKRNVSYLPPKMIYGMPDSVFEEIWFGGLSEEELFVLFHPEAPATREQFGSVKLIMGKNVLTITHHPHLNETPRDLSFTTTLAYQRDIRSQIEYNTKRLKLLGRDQYAEIREKLHPDIQKLGDAIYGKLG